MYFHDGIQACLKRYVGGMCFFMALETAPDKIGGVKPASLEKASGAEAEGGQSNMPSPLTFRLTSDPEGCTHLRWRLSEKSGCRFSQALKSS